MAANIVAAQVSPAGSQDSPLVRWIDKSAPRTIHAGMNKAAASSGQASRADVDFGSNMKLAFLVKDGIVFIAARMRESSIDMTFKFLADISQKFCQDFGKGGPHGSPDPADLTAGKCNWWAKTLEARVKFFNDPSNNKIAAAQEDLDIAKDRMADNIHLCLQRGEKIEDLVEGADGLAQESVRFRQETKRMKRMMCCRYYKWVLISVFVALILGALIMLIICKFKFDESPCDWSSSSSPPATPMPTGK
eukprot:TRINITY_DN10210_c0_g1_i1.p1 TRINITY_DN10210_c0_g1~~TRINITY_DN10210_c0_g1_i1.p1  ORF type:complete len:273 (+),score=81.75 TRINITY_DN10210_c0_g1_i1:78-821(+)